MGPHILLWYRVIDLFGRFGCRLYYRGSYWTGKHNQPSPVTATPPPSFSSSPPAEIDCFGQTNSASASLSASLHSSILNIYMREDMEQAFMSISVRLDSLEEVIEEKASVCFLSEADSETE